MKLHQGQKNRSDSEMKFKTPDKQLQTKGNIIRVGIPVGIQSDNRQQLLGDKFIYLDPQVAPQ